jgi:peptide/nickel transport system permease protein
MESGALMIRVIAGRVLSAVLVLIVLSIATFLLQQLMVGDPAFVVAGENARPEEVAAVRKDLGLDRPLVSQYFSWAGDAIHADFGTSWSVRRDQPVARLISDRIQVTLSLAVLAIVLAVIIALVLGTLSALFEGRRIDRAITAFSSLGMAVPSFWFGLLMIYVLSLKWRVLPAIGYVPIESDPAEWLRHLIMPALALAMASSAQLTRQLRASLTVVMRSEYIRTAYAEGLPARWIFLKHGVRNAALPVVTLLGLQLIHLLGGAVIIESLFTLPGLGTLVITAVQNKDLPIIQGVVLVFGIVAIVVNLLVDTTYGFLNPKVRTGGGRQR